MRLVPIAKIAGDKDSVITGIRLFDVDNKHIYEVSVQKFMELTKSNNSGIHIIENRLFENIYSLNIGGCSATANKLADHVFIHAEKLAAKPYALYIDTIKSGLRGFTRYKESNEIILACEVNTCGVYRYVVYKGNLEEAIEEFGKQNIIDVTSTAEKLALELMLLRQHAEVSISSIEAFRIVLRGNVPSIHIPEFVQSFSIVGASQIGKVTLHGNSGVEGYFGSLECKAKAVIFKDGVTIIRNAKVCGEDTAIKIPETIHSSILEINGVKSLMFSELISCIQNEACETNYEYLDLGNYIRIFSMYYVPKLRELKKIRFGRVPEYMNYHILDDTPKLEEIILGKKVTKEQYEVFTEKLGKLDKKVKITHEST